jgi:hypothetical protein
MRLTIYHPPKSCCSCEYRVFQQPRLSSLIDSATVEEPTIRKQWRDEGQAKSDCGFKATNKPECLDPRLTLGRPTQRRTFLQPIFPDGRHDRVCLAFRMIQQ